MLVSQDVSSQLLLQYHVCLPATMFSVAVIAVDSHILELSAPNQMIPSISYLGHGVLSQQLNSDEDRGQEGCQHTVGTQQV